MSVRDDRLRGTRLCRAPTQRWSLGASRRFRSVRRLGFSPRLIYSGSALARGYVTSVTLSQTLAGLLGKLFLFYSAQL